MATLHHALLISGGGLRCKGLCWARDAQAKVPRDELAYGYSSVRFQGRFIASNYTWCCWTCVNPTTITALSTVSRDRVECWSTLPEAAQEHVGKDIVAGRSTLFRALHPSGTVAKKRARDNGTEPTTNNSLTPHAPRKGDPATPPLVSFSQMPTTPRRAVDASKTSSGYSPRSTEAAKRQKLDTSSNFTPATTPRPRKYIQTDKSAGKNQSARSAQYRRTRALKKAGDAYNPYSHLEEVKAVIRLVAVVDLPLLDRALVRDVLLTKLYVHQSQGARYMLDKESSRLPQSLNDTPVDFWQMRMVYGRVQYYQLLSGEVAVASQPPEICRGGLLADDCGLGKTLTVLVAVYVSILRSSRSSTRSPTLVVAPPGVVQLWEDQVKQHFRAGAFNVLIWTGGNTQRREDLRSYDLVITSTTAMLSEWNASMSTSDNIHDSGRSLYTTKFKRVVFDDMHELIRSSSSQSVQAACAIKASHRWGMSATPFVVPQDLATVGQVLHAFGPLCKSEIFKALIADKIEAGSPGALDIFRHMFACIAIRRTVSMLGDDSIVLPELHQETVRVRLDSGSRNMYTVMEEMKRKNKNDVLKWDIHLAQLALHGALLPAHVASEIHAHGGDPNDVNAKVSSKMTAIVKIVLGLSPSDSAVVYSQSAAFLRLLQQELAARRVRTVRVDCEISPRVRLQEIDNFCAESTGSVALVSMKAGSNGFDMSFANNVIIAEPWWHRNIERQAIGRCFHPQQTRDVTVYRVIAQDTIDEKMAEAQAKKQIFLNDALASTMYVQVS